MPKKPSSTPVRKPEAKKAVEKVARKTVAAKAVKKIIAKKRIPKKPVAKKPDPARPAKATRPRAKVLKEHPDNVVVDAHDDAAVAALDHAKASALPITRVRKLTAVDLAAGLPVTDQPPAASLVERVSDAIERELCKIERIVGHPERLHPSQRVEAESRARVLASLARTLKEVMRLREQERGAGDDIAKAADDDAVPRDLDEFRRELSRRLEGLVAGAARYPGDNTYANFQEANRALWRQTILPLASRVGASIAQWLGPQFGGELRVVVDTDRIDALSTDRTALWDRVANAPFLTLNEKRKATGYAPVEGGDRLD